MIRAIFTGASGMMGQQALVDTTANNLANVNTTGFKKNQLNFQDLFYSTARPPGTEFLQGQPTPVGVQFGNGVRVASTGKIFLQGAFEQTGNALDLAIEGQGFFQVTGPNNTRRYTRDGSFKINKDGNMVTADGYLLDPQITFPPDVASISVGSDGAVWITTANNPNQSSQVGTIQLARFANPGGLSAEGNNLFRETPSSGEPMPAKPGEEGMGNLKSGFLERSNVDAISEMINLILAQRAFEFNSRSVTVADGMLKTANDLIR